MKDKNRLITIICHKCKRSILIDLESFLAQHQKDGCVKCVECSHNLIVLDAIIEGDNIIHGR